MVNVFVTCTARKTAAVPATLRMRNVRGRRVEERFEEWAARIVAGRADSGVRAMDLYAGNAWSVVRRISTATDAAERLRLWIVSAGCGLLTAEMVVPPYSATFTPGEPDCVLRSADQDTRETWWRLLSNGKMWRRDCRTIADVARTYPTDFLLAAVSTDYLSALESDFSQARRCLVDEDNLLIVSAYARKSGELASSFLPCDARMEHNYGRGRMALNARILESVLRDLKRGIPLRRIRESYGRILDHLPASTYPERERGSDERVRGFIRAELRRNPAAGHTSLLRAYRAAGLACEQSRFRGLYHEVTAKLE